MKIIVCHNSDSPRVQLALRKQQLSQGGGAKRKLRNGRQRNQLSLKHASKPEKNEFFSSSHSVRDIR
jgi:hypothetical protein